MDQTTILAESSAKLETLGGELLNMPPHQGDVLQTVRAPLAAVLAMLQRIKAADFTGVSPDAPTQLNQAVVHMTTALTSLKRNPLGSDRTALRDEAYVATRTFLDMATPLVAYFAATDQRQLDAVGKDLENRLEAAEEASQKITNILAAIKGDRDEAAKALATIRQTAAVAGVSTHAKDFSEVAQEHARVGRAWFWFTLALGVASIVLVYLLVKTQPLDENAKPAVIAQYVLTRALAFAFASYLTVWAARNYRAHRHLQVVNRHRAKALQTFQTFSGAALDDSTRNAILIETTRCIFVQGASGYSDEDPAGPVDRIVEVARTAVGKG
jgi:hypothetical protein